MKKALIYKPNNANDPIAQRMLKNQKVSIIVENFFGVNWWEKTKVFPVFTVYENPQDFPGKFVVRLFDGEKPTRLVAVKDTLEAARETIPPMFLRVERSQNDEHHIVETCL